MNTDDINPKDPSRSILVLFVFFLAIVLRDATIGALSATWVALIGGLIVLLSVSAILGSRH